MSKVSFINSVWEDHCFSCFYVCCGPPLNLGFSISTVWLIIHRSVVFQPVVLNISTQIFYMVTENWFCYPLQHRHGKILMTHLWICLQHSG